MENLPNEERVFYALFNLLSLSEKGVQAKDAYRILADRFGLTAGDMQVKMRNETRERHWNNRVRWARNDLRKKGYLDGSAPRGIWRLSAEGRAFARNVSSLVL